ncbi:hypothetical protein ABZY06_33950 [Streptomyces sp. NPDC006540]|uniref:hypothetical protein n=1 Tax=Streptomyces sp. NPDC006540 TaxID=3155353 RepID=UPI0033AE92E1
MATRIRINWDVVHSMLKTPEMQEVIRKETREMDERVNAMDVQSRVDFSADGERARGAVIAGYEDGATAETTRDALLRALGGRGG